MDKPILRRDLQPIVTLIGGRRVIRFHDPYRFVEEGIAIDAALLPILQMLDGRHNLKDIQVMLMMRQDGRMVYLSDIESFVTSLDGACLLESELFRERMEAVKRDFTSRSVREPAHAGKSYPSGSAALLRFIEETEAVLPEGKHAPEEEITGVLAPHLDIQVAKDAYVKAYRRLKGRPYDLAVVFGINHQPQEGLYCLSEKNYSTPLGEIRTDVDVIAEVKKRVPQGTLEPDDFCHRMEHSIEFQAIFLRHYLGASVPMVPVLCGGVHEFIFNKENIFTDGRFLGMVNVFEELAERRRVLFVAGVDLSHVGHKFGDRSPADAIVPRARADERELLSSIACGQPEKVFERSMQNQDRFHVCGLPSILIFSALLRRDRGEILLHETYDERATASAVNYASMIFTKA